MREDGYKKGKQGDRDRPQAYKNHADYGSVTIPFNNDAIFVSETSYENKKKVYHNPKAQGS
jgi:hypothetical protein